MKPSSNEKSFTLSRNLSDIFVNNSGREGREWVYNLFFCLLHLEVAKLARSGGLARPARFLGRAGLLKLWPKKIGPNLARSGMARPDPVRPNFFCLEKTI